MEGKPLLAMNGALVDVEASSHSHGGGAPTSPSAHVGADAAKPSYAWTASAFYRCLMLDEDALLGCREALRAAVEFGTIIAWFYVADRTSIIAPGTKVRSFCQDVGQGREGGGGGRCLRGSHRWRPRRAAAAAVGRWLGARAAPGWRYAPLLPTIFERFSARDSLLGVMALLLLLCRHAAVALL